MVNEMVDVINLIPDNCYEDPHKSWRYYWSDRKKTIPGIDRIVYIVNPEKEFKKIYKEYQYKYGEITMTKVVGINHETVNNCIIEISSDYLIAIINGMWEPWEQREVRYIYQGNHHPDNADKSIIRKRLPYCAVDCTFSLTQKGPECKKCPTVISGIEEQKKHSFARQQVKNAINSGAIIKPRECEACHKIKPLEAHHIDYDEPFHIIWLCRECHNEITSR